MVMQNGAGPFSKTELTIVERYKRAAVEDLDSPEILNLLKKIEDEIRRRIAIAADRE
ncbi:hypothetical protein [Bradyrhizobium sp. LMG 9283]|uniref:hypothetical protein n=1 Tax=Bradyrhizobium sp. LMG 9283 TaxID=592064 RepID=UPI00388E46A8